MFNRFLGAFFTMILTVALCFWLMSRLEKATSLTHHTGPTIEQIQKLSQLVTLKVDVADVLETQVKGYTGGAKAVILVKGDLLLSTDLSHAKFEQMDQQHRTATLILPSPQVAQPRLDHNKTRLFALTEYGLWSITPSDKADRAVLNQAYREAQEIVAGTGEVPDLKEQAKKHTEECLGSFFRAMNWVVTVKWL